VATFLVYLLGMLLVGGVIFLLVSFVFGRGEALAPVPPDAVPVELPEDRPAVAEDLRLLRLPVVLRGYRMHEVDWVLDRLATELELRDTEIARLRAELAGELPPELEEEPPIWVARSGERLDD
jgi:DivIVA domain-containing protein